MKLNPSRIILDKSFTNKEEAIRFTGQHLINEGLVNPEYANTMLTRESLTTTYIGNGVAIPHGTDESRIHIIQDGFVVIQVPQGIDFGNEKAYILFGLAGSGAKHMEFLSKIAIICSEIKNVEAMRDATTKEAIIRILEGDN